MQLNSKLPSGPIETAWDRRKFEMKLVNPANKRKYSIIVVGSGLAGGAASATLAELGYYVKCFCFQDSPRRAHSIAAQGGINAAKNYQNDGDSIFRLFYDTVKGGDFRSREQNVYRLAQISVGIIDAFQSLLRRRPGVANFLRSRPDRPTTVAGRLPGPGAPDRHGQGYDVSAH
jgi:succinate dehydrogenase / fumarate reductase flavoprotein subunit